MRVAVLPREDAARVITSAVARGAWAVSAASLAVTIPLLIEFMLARDAAAALPVPLAILVGLLLFATGAALVPRPWVVAAFLVIGTAGAVLYELSLLSAYPAIVGEGFFLLNRPAVSLVLIGVGASTTIVGVAWTLAGYLISTLVSVTVAVITGTAVMTGWGPLLMLTIYLVAYLVLGAIQSSQRRRVPNFEELERETRRLAVEENLRARLTAAVHDTLLNDLSIIMNAPDTLDERTTSRLRADIATLTSAEWLRESADADVVLDDQDVELRNQIMLMMSDLQWRGLTVHVTGSGSGIYRLAPDAATAIVDAIRACLENVLRHSGTTVAEVDLAYSDSEVTVIVTDQGVGFDHDAIPADRLGLRGSVTDRIRRVGGDVKVWSSPGAGTSIVMRVPVIEVVTEHEESSHGRA